jgi:hypothetical protein
VPWEKGVKEDSITVKLMEIQALLITRTGIKEFS